MKLAIVIPAYNEEKRIQRTLEAYTRFFDSLVKKKILTYELIIVINNTRDATPQIVQSFQKKNPAIRSLQFVQGGKGFAITEGFREALRRNFDVIGFVDADMSTEPQYFYELAQRLGEYDGTIASRYEPTSKVYPRPTRMRVFVSRVFNFMVRTLFLMPYRDTQCGAKLFRREVIKTVLPQFTITEWAYDIDLLYLARKNCFVIRSVPTVWHDAEGSTLRLVGGSLDMFFSIIQLRLLHSPFHRLNDKLERIRRPLYRFLINRSKRS